MDEREDINVSPIPANYTDSGKIFGGLLSIRNAFEALIILGLIGYLEYTFIPMSGTIRVIVMAVSLIPLAILAMIGINGDSLFTFINHMIIYLFRRRRLHFRRAERNES